MNDNALNARFCVWVKAHNLTSDRQYRLISSPVSGSAGFLYRTIPCPGFFHAGVANGTDARVVGGFQQKRT